AEPDHIVKQVTLMINPPQRHEIIIPWSADRPGHRHAKDTSHLEGFYANRTDFIRTAIRRQLESRAAAVNDTVARRTLTLGTVAGGWILAHARSW
ncbi:MAG: hypothetical protein ACRDSR_27050, partial [Pseudonocardiaceae bacterium]